MTGGCIKRRDTFWKISGVHYEYSQELRKHYDKEYIVALSISRTRTTRARAVIPATTSAHQMLQLCNLVEILMFLKYQKYPMYIKKFHDIFMFSIFSYFRKDHDIYQPWYCRGKKCEMLIIEVYFFNPWT